MTWKCTCTASVHWVRRNALLSTCDIHYRKKNSSDFHGCEGHMYLHAITCTCTYKSTYKCRVEEGLISLLYQKVAWYQWILLRTPDLSSCKVHVPLTIDRKHCHAMSSYCMSLLILYPPPSSPSLPLSLPPSIHVDLRPGGWACTM